MSDLFLRYKKERENVESIQVDGGFITYKFLPDYCYIEDFYIVPELRRTGLIYDLASQVEEIARKQGYLKMLGSVVIDTNNPEISLIGCLKHGYKILKLEGNIIWLHKELLSSEEK